jgi:hypothetical protein
METPEADKHLSTLARLFEDDTGLEFPDFANVDVDDDFHDRARAWNVWIETKAITCCVDDILRLRAAMVKAQKGMK